MEANRIYHRENADFAYLVDDGTFPNNPRFPLLRYRNVVSIQGPDPAAIFERLFNDQGWAGSWRDGVYDMHHYHSTAHEVLGVYSGTAVVQFGAVHFALNSRIACSRSSALPTSCWQLSPCRSAW